MLPNIQTALNATLTTETNASKTYSLEDGSLIDDLDAIRQAVFLALSVPRYQYLIYSWDYGSELDTLIGQSYEYALSEIKRYITEALTQDERVQSVDDFGFTRKGSQILCVFVVTTDFGTFSAETEVEI
ncbi:DUF2634 domain-containing protein [Solibaculum mannosilyticum]|uniref:DUF2634 domain-containing protein n=1 Tax=Solibaculum mannosilyticum TaxID=2780922 RepID=UPI0007A8CBC6|nr:hypothetical protein BN3661_01532 [Eubacteriaceae bacterium CHKCI005]